MEAQQSSFQTNSKLASIVQSNCQYLSHIRHNLTIRTEMARKCYQTLNEYTKRQQIKLNYGALLQLIIELAYFLYACKTYHVYPEVDFTDLRVQEDNSQLSQRRFSINIWYKIQQQKMQKQYAAGIFIKIVQYIQEALKECLANHKQQKDVESQWFQQQQQFLLFVDQFKMLINNSFFLKNQSLFFLCLQQTSLFYQKSMLYRIKNCSILDYIKTDEKKLNLFRVVKVKDESLVIEYNKLKIKQQRSQQQQDVIRMKQQQIESNIREFFRTIDEKNYQMQTKNQKDWYERVKFNFVVHQRTKYAFEQFLQNMQGSDVFRNDSKRLMQCRRIPASMEYFMEYLYQKNQIFVKVYSQLVFSNAQIGDSLIFRPNVYTYQSLAISFQLSLPRNTFGGDKRQLIFKGNSLFLNKQPPLQKMLLLIDLVMIVSKIYERQIGINFKPSSGSVKDYQGAANLSKKIHHYIKLFMKCGKKIYSG